MLKYIEEQTDRAILERAIERLTDREKRIIEERFVKEKTQKEVADLLGISQSYISRLEKKILKKLRKEIKQLE